MEIRISLAWLHLPTLRSWWLKGLDRFGAYMLYFYNCAPLDVYTHTILSWLYDEEDSTDLRTLRVNVIGSGNGQPDDGRKYYILAVVPQRLGGY